MKSKFFIYILIFLFFSSFISKKESKICLDSSPSIMHTNKEINIIGFKNIDCSTTENIKLLENYLKKNHDVRIFDIKDIENVYNCQNNIICIQPFDISENILKKFVYKPSVLWVWEFKDLPIQFKKIEKYFSKIYTVSNFCLNIFLENLSLPVEKIELKSQIHNYIDNIKKHKITCQLLNNILNATDNKIRYGYCFDLNSSIVRKNVLNLIKVFSSLKNSNKVLILKTRPYRGFPTDFEYKIIKQISEIQQNSDNIYIINEQIPVLDLYKLYTYFDYYISPHCGEGYGITIYDNQLLGNRIISPYYSGETDYLNRDEIIELDYEEVEIEGLMCHPIYKNMKSYIGAYISEENIYKSLNV